MDYDAVIAGAGPAGLFPACELGVAGLRTLVLERFSDPHLPTRGPALGGRGLNIASMEAFYRRGLMDELRNSAEIWFGLLEEGPGGPELAAGPPIRFAGHFAGILLDGALIDYGDPEFRDKGPAAAGCLIDLVSLEKVLARRAGDLGISIRRGEAVTAFSQTDDTVTIHTSAGTVRAGWLIGCDGGRSTVRKLAGFAFPGTPPEITAYGPRPSRMRDKAGDDIAKSRRAGASGQGAAEPQQGTGIISRQWTEGSFNIPVSAAARGDPAATFSPNRLTPLQ